MSDKRFTLAITGPAGSGKSTVAEKLAKQLDRCVNIDADHIKHMIVSGFSYEVDSYGSKKWEFNQWDLVGDSIGLLARNFLNNDYDVIINGYIDEPAWDDMQKHIAINYKILLLPHIDTIIERDSSRNDEVVMGEEEVKKHHNYFSNDSFFKDFVGIDSTKLSVEETVNKIMRVIQL